MVEPIVFLRPGFSRDATGPIDVERAGSAVTSRDSQGSGWVTAQAATNLIRNPRAATSLYVWGTDANRTVTRVTDVPEGLPYGIRTGLLVDATSTLSGAQRGASTSGTVDAAGMHTASAYVYVPAEYESGPLAVRLSFGSSFVESPVDMGLRNVWQRVILDAFDVQAGSLDYVMESRMMSGTWNSGDAYFMSCVQLEPTEGVTPYFDGGMGDGYSFRVGAHTSPSERTNGSVQYVMDEIPIDRGSVVFRFRFPESLESLSANGVYLQSVGQIGGGQSNLTLMYRTPSNQLAVRTGTGVNVAQLGGPNPEPWDILTVYLEWTEDTIGVDWGRGDGLQVATRGSYGMSGWAGNAICLGNSHPSYPGNMMTYAAMCFDRPLTDRERTDVLSIETYAWSTLGGDMNRIAQPTYRSGVYRIEPTVYQANRDNVIGRDISDVVTDMSRDIDIDRKGTRENFEIKSTDVSAIPANAWIAPFKRVIPETGSIAFSQRGLYQLGQPRIEYDANGVVSASNSGTDIIKLLTERTLTEPEISPPGSIVIEEVRAAVEMATAAIVGDNIVPNNGFDDHDGTNFTGWTRTHTDGATGSTTGIADSAIKGSRAGVGLSGPTLSRSLFYTTTAQSVPSSWRGSRYFFDVWNSVTAAGIEAWAFIRFYDSAGGLIGDQSSLMNTRVGRWYRITIANVVPENAATYRVYLSSRLTEPGTNKTVWWDEVRFRTCYEAPLTRHAFPDDDRTLVREVAEKPGVSWYARCVSLLKAIGMYVPHATADGRPTSRRYRSVATDTPSRIYDVKTDARLTRPIVVESTDNNLYNEVIALQEDYDSGTVTWAVARNVDRDDPWSIPNRGVISYPMPVMGNEAVDIDTLKLMARDQLDRASQQIAVDFTVCLCNTNLTVYDIVELVGGDGPEIGRWGLESIREGLTAADPLIDLRGRRTVGYAVEEDASE